MNSLFKNKKFLFLGIFGACVLLYSVFKAILYLTQETVRIAVVGPMSGPNKANGKAYLNGINLFLEPFVEKGGFEGKKVIIDVYDDENDPEKAKEMAQKILQDNKALAVIGHNRSSCSIAAAPIYKDKIVAVSPASTSVALTKQGDWYFRTIFNDDSQGRFLAYYLRKVLKVPQVKIVHEEDTYGKNLAEVFAETARNPDLKLGITLNREVKVKDASKVDAEMEKAVQELAANQDNQFVFVAMSGSNGAKFVKLYRKYGIKNPMIAPDAFASQGFLDALAEGDPKEADNPGYYSNGIYVTTPLIFDNANQKAQSFRDRYLEKYKEIPDWRAVYAYDSILVILEAVKRKDLSGSVGNLEEERKAIRDYLHSISLPQEAIEGATGLNYFKNGDSPKPVSIGVYKNKNIISALSQLQVVKEASEILNPEDAIAKDLIIKIEDTFMYKTNVIYTGIEINEITDLKVNEQTYNLDFYMWFRYLGDSNPWDIEFGNALEPVKLEDDKIVLREEDPISKAHYRLYHLKGKFRSNSLPKKFVLGQIPLGVSFHHNSLGRNNLIYVIDVVGMGLSVTGQKKTIDHVKRAQVLSPSTGQLIESDWSFQDTLKKTSLGNPKYLGMSDPSVDFSRFNMGVQIRKDEISLRRFMPGALALFISIISLGAMMGLGILSSLKSYKKFTNIIWFGQTVMAYCLLSATEVEIVEQLIKKESIPSIRLIMSVYDLLWWIIPSISVTQAVERFLWIPLEARTDHKIPTVVRKFLNFLIYLMTLFGIVAFVYDQKITSLLASTGVVAMIIGLAIQVNISNVFSGIAINMERPFRVGDWIKIGNIDEGKVVDITWRTTRIQLRNQVLISIPNSMASESAIINYSLPDGIVETWFTIHIDPSIPPKRVVKVLLDAILSAEGVLRIPGPYARFNEFTDWSADYLFGYCYKDYGKKNAVRRTVWASIWTHLHRAGISPAFQKQQILLNGEEFMKITDVRSPNAILEEIEIFEPFTPEEKMYLSQKLRPLVFNPGEKIVKAGDNTNFSMFIIVEGLVSVQVPLENGEFLEVARLGAGNFFGEMSLLTGAIRTANIIADSKTHVFEITKEDIQPLLDAHPEIANSVKSVVTERKENLQSKKQEALYVPPPQKESLFKRLKKKGFALLGLQKELEEEPTDKAVKK
jgi:potassium-dependent mechanosensitive channel